VVKYRPPEGAAARARRLRRDPTDAETALWRLLRGNFPDEHFRRQVLMREFTADFACHRARLIIKVDGGQHGGAKGDARTRLIEAEGYRVLRFWKHEVLGNSDGVATVIASALTGDHPHPTLPHQGGGL
jgi:very-short-patch-repair endonuclease